MGVDRKKGRRDMLTLLLGLAVLAAIAAALFAFKYQRLEQAMDRQNEHYLEEVSRHTADLAEERVARTIRTLNETAILYAANQGDEGADGYLEQVAQRFGYWYLGVADENGVVRTSDGRTEQWETVGGWLAGPGGLDGELALSYEGGRGDVLYRVPLHRPGGGRAWLTAAVMRGNLYDALTVKSFEGAGYTQIIDPEGNFLVDANRTGSPEGNLFDLAAAGRVGYGDSLDAVRSDIAAGRAGTFCYTRPDGEVLVAAYQPLNIEGWCLLSVVPERVADQAARAYLNVALLADLGVILLFLLLLCAAICLFGRNRKRLERLAYVDPVTGGASRARFEEEAGDLIRAAPSGGYALVAMDLDRFKLINDTFGSENGNKTLRYIYRAISRSLEKGELVARITADHFYLLLRYSSHGETERRLEEVAARINAFNDTAAQKYYLTCYQGAYVIEDPEMNMITIQDRANVARKSLKRGRQSSLSACAFYADIYRERMLREKDIDNRMEEALRSGQFEVFLQPKVELRWNTVAGAEALVRWRDPERGLVPPDEFIPLFERNGFVVQLDRYVFSQVCGMLRRWTEEGRALLPISVNLSRVNLEDPHFWEAYERIRSYYAIPPELIEFELTETTVFENMQALGGVMQKLHELGFRCSLDDFGSGYSSLNLLKDIPADAIKLDRGFFAGLGGNPRGEAVVDSIIGLARRLRMQTVCEGVEEQRQVEFLRRAGCDAVQGFIFSRPVPIPEFEALAFSGRPVPMRETKSAPGAE